MTPSSSTAPTYGVQDWVRILHNAARTPQGHPRYAEARQVAQLALDNIDELHQSTSAAERQQALPSLGQALVVGLGHGASQGLLSGQVQGPATAQSFPTSRGAPPVAGFGGTGYQTGAPTPDENYAQFLASARETYPWPMRGAEAAGGLASGLAATPLVAGLSLAKAGAVLGAGSGAVRGAIDPIPGFSRTESALIMGAGGAIGNAVAGKLISKLVPIGAAMAKNARGLLGKMVPGLAKSDAAAMEEAAFREGLKRLNVHPKMVERAVAAWKTGKVPQGAIDLPPMEPTVSRVGETITPMEPQLPTLRAQADVMATQPAYVRVGNPNNLPTGTGPMAPPQAGMPLGVPGTLQALEQQAGRPLTPPEVQSALERLLGPLGSPIPRSYGRPP